ncbi:MAG: NAD(P)H-dependent oxidoreductase subunit E, partial [Oscillospiraceae bacterium]|nr:NAD(P)H-dependent oxidoreductase subunit E [Oscillospiraceae bacterium]
MCNTINLEERKRAYTESVSGYKAKIIICAGTGCMAGGSMKIYHRFREVIAERGLSVTVALEKEKTDYILAESGCQGFCQMGPLVTLLPRGVLYTKVQPDDVEEIVDTTLIGGGYVERLLFSRPDNGEYVRDMNKIPFYALQQRAMLRLCGNIDVADLDEYIANDGYFMARRAVLNMTDVEICQALLDSGLRGRGGGG